MPHLSQGVDFHCVRCTKFLEAKRVISKQCGLREMISHILLSRVGHRLRQRCPDHYRCPVGRSSAVLKKATCLSLAASRTVGMGSNCMKHGENELLHFLMQYSKVCIIIMNTHSFLGIPWLPVRTCSIEKSGV